MRLKTEYYLSLHKARPASLVREYVSVGVNEVMLQ